MSTTTFFTAANALYEPFVVPYIISVLHHNADAVVEICVEDCERFKTMYSKPLSVIAEHYQDRLLLRSGHYKKIRAASVRFLEAPTLRNEYTYIADIDILILEGNITARHVDHMTNTNLPYSNRIRPPSPLKKPRLTGLHFTQTAAHYPLVVSPEWSLMQNAEELLYRLVEAKGLPLPDPADTFRPAHGIHLSVKRSPTRAPNAGPPWTIADYHIKPYLKLLESTPWQEASEYLHPAYRALLMVLEATIQAKQTDRLVYRRNEAVALWRRLTLDSLGAPVDYSEPTPIPTPDSLRLDEIEVPNVSTREMDLEALYSRAGSQLETIEAELAQLLTKKISKKKKANRELLRQTHSDVAQLRAEFVEPRSESAK